jgi:hypothetical protein
VLSPINNWKPTKKKAEKSPPRKSKMKRKSIVEQKLKNIAIKIKVIQLASIKSQELLLLIILLNMILEKKYVTPHVEPSIPTTTGLEPNSTALIAEKSNTAETDKSINTGKK